MQVYSTCGLCSMVQTHYIFLSVADLSQKSGAGALVEAWGHVPGLLRNGDIAGEGQGTGVVFAWSDQIRSGRGAKLPGPPAGAF